MVAKSGMGSGLICNPTKINNILERAHNETDILVSMKMRMGYDHAKEILDVFPILDQYPLKNIAIHARIGKQLYKGPVNLDAFERCITKTKHKLYYNFNNQGYATENNSTVKFLKDQTANNYKGTFLNMSLLGVKNNFANDIIQINANDDAIASFDANSLDSYPGNGHGFNGNSELCPTCWIDLTPNAVSSFVFFNSLQNLLF